jgi:hypothetical protein
MNFDFDKILGHVSKVKLSGGVVGKACTVLIVTAVCLAGLGMTSGNDWIIGGGMVGILLIVFVMLWRLINFADKNPQSALLEGAEFLVHQQMILGTKTNPTILVQPGELVEEQPAPAALAPGAAGALGPAADDEEEDEEPPAGPAGA